MRKKFEQQYSMDIIPISEVKIINNKRDELPPILLGLQHIFVTPELSQEIFKLLSSKIVKGKKTGRYGMDLWHILVLGVIRMGLEANYDRLLDLANNHKLIRKIMGVEKDFGQGVEFKYTTIKENVSLLDDAIIDEINTIVVKAGHKIVKKKEEKLKIKADTYVLETNVHFPTDINLLWDAGRKCLDTIINLTKEHKIEGWRKVKLWYRKLKNQSRNLSKACQSGGKNKEQKVIEEAEKYLFIAKGLNEKIHLSNKEGWGDLNPSEALISMIQLDYFQGMLTKHIDLVERRLIKGETIPASEKIYSIFETHSEWIKKGKANNKVEIGHNILVVSDQYQFILYHKVVEHQVDVKLAIPMARELTRIYGRGAFHSGSFDKGFWKKENKEELRPFFEIVVLPKKGKKNKAEQEEESSKEFRKLRHMHSAVESNINSLEHHSLNRCPDKGLRNFKKYAAFGVLAYNLHRLGIVLMNEQEKAAA
ncbi:MAG: ISNCY family transposase, partial [Bacteroidota bacterium]